MPCSFAKQRNNLVTGDKGLILSSPGSHNEKHVRSNPAVKSRAGTGTQGGPTHRRRTVRTGRPLLRNTSTHNVRSSTSADQPGAEGALGKAASTKANDLSIRAAENCSGAAGKVGEGEEGGVATLVIVLSSLIGKECDHENSEAAIG
jgi:hypothetical protein